MEWALQTLSGSTLPSTKLTQLIPGILRQQGFVDLDPMKCFDNNDGRSFGKCCSVGDYEECWTEGGRGNPNGSGWRMRDTIGIYKICHPCRYCVDLYNRCYVGNQSLFKWCIIIWEIFLVSWVEFSSVDQLQGVLREQQNSSRCTLFNVMWKCKVVIPLRVWILIYTDFWYCARTTTILIHVGNLYIYTYFAIPLNFQAIFEC